MQVTTVAAEQELRAKQEQERLHHEATHDELTGLLNRRGLEEVLANNEPPKAILYVDVTGLKIVNDKLGHPRGDDAIKKTTNVLVKSLRPDDVVARVGGDEFLVLLDTKRRSGEPPLTPEDHLDPVTSRIAQETLVVLEKNPDLRAVGFDIAVGGAVWQEGMSVNDLSKVAEKAMYEQKGEQHQVSGLPHRS